MSTLAGIQKISNGAKIPAHAEKVFPLVVGKFELLYHIPVRKATKHRAPPSKP
jgi:hypothetical protein